MRIPFQTHALSASLVLALAIAACEPTPDASGADTSVGRSFGEPAETARVDFIVAGMDCAGCVIATRTALRRLDGVHDAGAAFETMEASSAWAVYDPDRVHPDRMIEAIGELGYDATVSEERR